MKHYYMAILLFCFFVCHSTSKAQQSNEVMMVSTTTRSYIKYLPVGLDIEEEEVSLVFVLHGLGDVNTTMASGGFNYLADTARIIAIYPQGLQNGFGQNSWNTGTVLSSNADDISFFNQLITQMITVYNVDPAKVYFAGFSMGSIMSYHMAACALNDRIAAVGGMAGTMPAADMLNCSPDYATPVIHLHGTQDSMVPYDGDPAFTLSTVPQTINFWKNAHGCDATADSLRLPDTANDGITVDRFLYDDCSPEGSVELWRLNGADHIYLREPINDITEMIEVWRFLRRWEHPAPAETAGVNEKNGEQHLSVMPNPSQGSFVIKGLQCENYTIRTLNGSTVATGELKAGETTVDLAGQADGVYLLHAGTAVYKLVKN